VAIFLLSLGEWPPVFLELAAYRTVGGSGSTVRDRRCRRKARVANPSGTMVVARQRGYVIVIAGPPASRFSNRFSDFWWH
jgi:hypothetical protein